ncbi:hypothetical protein Q1695_014361 [Nippostrongylus brasiliensis]|nr:hypothetical protein Q1695_014361 [Nippostrongylus brasiliensis]
MMMIIPVATWKGGTLMLSRLATPPVVLVSSSSSSSSFLGSIASLGAEITYEEAARALSSSSARLGRMMRMSQGVKGRTSAPTAGLSILSDIVDFEP